MYDTRRLGKGKKEKEKKKRERGEKERKKKEGNEAFLTRFGLNLRPLKFIYVSAQRN
jgi:hypothetical protein